MEIHLEVRMERALFAKILRAGMRRHFRRYWAVGGVAAGAGLAATVLSPGVGGVALLVVGLAVCAMPWLIVAWSCRRLERLPREPWSYRITSEELEEATPIVRSTRPWTAIREVRETDDLWVLLADPAGIVGLPKRAFAAEEAARFRAFLAARER